MRFLRKKLGVKEHESVFCYLGNVFSPSLDEVVGNLFTVSDDLTCLTVLKYVTSVSKADDTS